jgi:hypothetical protein
MRLFYQRLLSAWVTSQAVIEIAEASEVETFNKLGGGKKKAPRTGQDCEMLLKRSLLCKPRALMLKQLTWQHRTTHPFRRQVRSCNMIDQG